MKSFLKNLFFLKEHITLKVINVFYLLGMILMVLTVLGTTLQRLMNGEPIQALIVLLVSCLPIILFRIICEFITIAFGVFDKLEEIRCGITGEKPKKKAKDDFDLEKCCGTFGDKVKDLAVKAKEKADEVKAEKAAETKAEDTKAKEDKPKEDKK